MALDTDTFAHMIAQALIEQGLEIDNLGDDESIIFMNDPVIINLAKVAESLIAKFIEWLGPMEGIQ